MKGEAGLRAMSQELYSIKKFLALLSSFALCGVAFGAPPSDDYKEGAEIARAGNAWREGEPIPSKLLDYRTSWDGSCFPSWRGTEMLFGSITNYALLWQIGLLPHTDLRIFTNAVNRALLVAGPNGFFRDLANAVRKQPELQGAGRIRILEKQSKVRHIVVDSIYIKFADLAPDAALKALNDLSRELQEGKPWHDVYWKSLEQYQSDGKTGVGICNLGDFVLPANGDPMFSFREHWMPKSHLKKLLAAKAGDTLILFDKEDLSSFPDLFKSETGERYVLHRVREVYSGR